MIKNFEMFQIPFTQKSYKQEFTLIVIIGVALLLTFYLNTCSKGDWNDAYSTKFVDSLSKGQVYLDVEPSEGLLSLDNPYDYSERDSAGLKRGTDYLWDIALYNGKYYEYFGILPALILLVPYHLITGEYMNCATGVLIFSIFTLISMKALIKNIFDRFFKKVPFKFMVFSLLILIFGSQIFILNGIPRFYELPIISGLFFAMTGINFMFAATKNENIRYKYMFLSALFLSLAVACRPTQLLTSIIVLPIIIKIFIKNVKDKKDIVKNIFAVGVPYAVVGILLMYYNYIRFGSIFEFGASYQITIHDMVNLQNRFMTIGMGIVCNLFSIPNISTSFPFISNHNKLLAFQGYYYIENMVGGLFILVPICFAIFTIRKVLKRSENKNLKQFILVVLGVGILLCIVSAMMAGSMQRYIVDYAWLLIIASLCILLEIYNTYKSDEAKNIVKKIFAVLTMYIVIVNICAGVVSEKSYMQNNSPEEFYKLRYSVDFWE